MTHPEGSPVPPERRWLRWLRRLGWWLGGGLLALLLLFAALPSALSTGWVRTRIAAVLTEKLGRPVQLEELRLAWSGAFDLSGVRVADGPALSPEALLELDSLRLRVSPGALLRGRVEASLNLRGLRANLIRDAQGRSNLDGLLAANAPPAAAAEPAGEPAPPAPLAEGPPRLPFRDLDLTVRLDDLALTVEDRVAGRTASLADLSLHVDVHPPQYALVAALRSRLRVDDRELPPLTLDLAVADLLGPGGALTPTAATVAAKAQLPGVRAEVDGGLGGGQGPAQVAGDVQVDLAEVLAALEPFLPAELAGTEARGQVQVELQADGDPDAVVDFQLGVRADAVELAGPLLSGRRVGPVALRLEQAGTYRTAGGVLDLAQGTLHLQEASRIAWQGVLRGLDGAAPEADLAVGPVDLDLRELHLLALPFLPAEPSLAWRAGPPPRLRLASVTLRGPLAAAPGGAGQQVELRGLAFLVPGLDVAGAAAPVQLAGLRLGLASLRTQLSENFPTGVDLELDGALESLTLGGEQPVAVRDLALRSLRVNGRELRPAGEGAPVPLSGALELSQRLELGAVTVGETLQLRGLEEQLEVGCRLLPDGGFALDLRSLRLAVAALHHASGSGAAAQTVDLGDAGGRPGLAVALEALHVAGPSPQEPAAVNFGSLRVELGNVAQAQGPQTVAVRSLDLEAAEVAVALSQGFPRELAATVQAAAAGVAVSGAQAVTLAEVRVPQVRLAVRDLAPSAAALFGVAGTFQLEQALLATGLDLPGQLQLPELRQRLAFAGQLADGPGASFQVQELAVDVPVVRVFGVAAEGEAPVETDLHLAVELPDLRLTGTAPEQVSFAGLAVNARVGRLLRVTAKAAADALGQGALQTSGDLSVDLTSLAELPAPLRAGGRFGGAVALTWQLAGRLPSAVEQEGLQGDPLAILAADAPLPFLDGLELALTLADVAAELPGADGERLSVGGISTTPALRLNLADQGRSLELDAGVAARWVEELPGLPPLAEPLDVHLTLSGGLRGGDALQVAQRLRVLPLGLEEEFTVALGGLRRLAQLGWETPRALLLTVLGGEAAFSARVGESVTLGELAGDLALAGPLAVEAQARLVRGEELSGRVGLSASDAAVHLGDRLRVEGLDGRLEFAKRVRLVRGAATPGGAPSAGDGREFLSEQVLRTAAAGSAAAPAEMPAPSGGGLRLRRLWAAAEPLPVTLENLHVQVGLPGGLPALERFQADFLGGTVISALGFTRGADGYRVGGELTFTGLDARRLLPPAAGVPPEGGSEDAEVSGQVGFVAPLSGEFEELLAGMEMNLGFTHVGPRTLDRALYALDPAESNEAILEQRRLVRLGRPLWVAVGARNGNLNLTGEVSLVGVRVALPAVERFPLSQVPGWLRLAPAGETLAELGRTLDLLSADRLLLQSDGGFQWAHSLEGVKP